MDIYSTIALWTGALLTVATLSFLYKYNPAFRLAENIFVGITLGYTALFAVKVVIEGLANATSRVYVPIGFALGLTLYVRYLPRKYHWVTRYPAAVLVGVSTGIFMTGTAASDVKAQIVATSLNLSTTATLDLIKNLIIILFTITTLTYFVFTREHKGALGVSAKVGRLGLLISLGAVWGSAMMARFTLIGDIMRYLLVEWLGLA